MNVHTTILAWHKDMDNDADPGEWRAHKIVKITKCFIFISFGRRDPVRVKLDREHLETFGYVYSRKHGRRFYTKEGANQ